MHLTRLFEKLFCRGRTPHTQSSEESLKIRPTAYSNIGYDHDDDHHEEKCSAICYGDKLENVSRLLRIYCNEC
uniref:Uncharacterized protein n=1 Tax=Romanomermis culicivorax TaxID=13658 RepID=A0A915IIC9_ROMCU